MSEQSEKDEMIFKSGRLQIATFPKIGERNIKDIPGVARRHQEERE